MPYGGPEPDNVGSDFARALSAKDRVALESVLDPRIADRHHLHYRLRVENGDGMHLVEQQGYYDVVDGRVTKMSLVCSGYRPWEDGSVS